jgi:hypothetical protein
MYLPVAYKSYYKVVTKILTIRLASAIGVEKQVEVRIMSSGVANSAASEPK